MNAPAITPIAEGQRYGFKEYLVSVTTQRIRTSGDGVITGELDIESTAPAITPELFYGKFNFLSLETRQRLAGYLKGKYDTPPWIDILETVCRNTINVIRRGDKFTEINSNVDPPPDVEFDVFPLLQTNQPTTIYGDGGTGKSYLALTLAVAYRLGWHDNQLGLTIKARDANPEIVWLDFETSQDDFHRRLHRLVKGMGLKETLITYRRCSQVLADEIDELAVLVNMRGPGLVVIDSVGAACAGDLHGSEAPTRFFNAIRRFQGSKLLIFHTNREKELYGNRFFWNFSRHIWEIKKQQSEGDDNISVGMFHRKANETKLFNPLGFTLYFKDNKVTIERTDVSDIPTLADGLPMRERITALLKYGPLPVREIAEELREDEHSLRTTLAREKTRFIKVDDKWGLLTNDAQQ